jgi:hypothetical protein
LQSNGLPVPEWLQRHNPPLPAHALQQ